MLLKFRFVLIAAVLHATWNYCAKRAGGGLPFVWLVGAVICTCYVPVLVVYWYWAHDRAIAGEYAAKFYLVTDSIRMHRSDGSLIRLSTPLGPDQDADAAQRLLLSFATNLVPLINTYVPR